MTVKTPARTQRIDKWLWYARFFKTRSLAGKAVTDGAVRLTRLDQTQRVVRASFAIQPEDTLAFAKGKKLFIVRINLCATRRGPASEAQLLYEDLSPPPPAKDEKAAAHRTNFERDQGAGRPTKKDRRELERLRTDL